MAKIGVLLSGCGVYDGSEIHEAVLTLLALDRAGADIQCLAPDMEQQDVVNHLTGETQSESRNVLVESARIARGNIKNISKISVADLDALIIPGGFGAAKNLSDFASRGVEANVRPEVEHLLKEMLGAGKPIGAICIAPATLVKALADWHPEVTIGSDLATATAVTSMGGKHYDCAVDEIHVDDRLKIVTTPAYMLGPGIKEVQLALRSWWRQCSEWLADC